MGWKQGQFTLAPIQVSSNVIVGVQLAFDTVKVSHHVVAILGMALSWSCKKLKSVTFENKSFVSEVISTFEIWE